MAAEEDVVARALEVGNKQFKLQQYDQSVKIYTKALVVAESLDQKTISKLRATYNLNPIPAHLDTKDKLYHPKIVAILDGRSAAYEKLNDCPAALRDALKAVSIEPYNARGYVRTGKVLISMKKDKKAHDAFKKGIERVNKGKEKYGYHINTNLMNFMQTQVHLLSKKLKPPQPAKTVLSNSASTIKSAKELMRSRTNSSIDLSPTPSSNASSVPDRKRVKLSPSYSTQPSKDDRILDFLTLFPIEIVTDIFHFLSQKDLMNSLLVSREWNDTLSRVPQLFNEIVISKYASLKDLQSCFELLSKAKRRSQKKSINLLQARSIRRTDERQILNLLLNKTSLVFDSLDLNFMDVTTEQLVDCLYNSRHALKKLQELRHLNIACVMVPGFEEKLLDLLPQLESLEIMRSPDNKRPSSLKKQDITLQRYKNLKKLSLVGDIKQKYPSIPFSNLFTSRVSLMPNLTSLTIVGYDFNTLNNTNIGFNFLQNVPNAQTLIFENNYNFNLATFLKAHDVLEFKQLRKLVIRESEVRYSEHLPNIDTFYLHKIFGNLSILDLTGSSISYQGLSKILSVCGERLIQLSIGYCQNVIFKKGPYRIHVNGGFFDFDEFFRWCPNIQVLYLNQATDFCDYSLTQFINTLKAQSQTKKMKLLDLSFNEASGYKLLELLKYLQPQHLMLHGMDINSGTIKLMEEKFRIKVESRIDKPNWREYGINSYNPF